MNYSDTDTNRNPFSVMMALVSLLVVSACASVPEPKLSVDPLAENTILSGTSSLQHTVISKKGVDIFLCTQPAPDTAFDSTRDGGFSLNLLTFGGGKEDASEADSDVNVELEGRTPALLQTRELLYRLCEFDRNHDLELETAIELYKLNLKIITEVMTIQAKNTQITIGETTAVDLREQASDSLGSNSTPNTTDNAEADDESETSEYEDSSSDSSS